MKNILPMMFLGFVLSFTGCNHDADLKKAEADFARTNADVNRDLDIQLHAANVKLARNIVGDHGAFLLDECYSEGYKDAASPKPDSLSNRKKDACDHILVQIERVTKQMDAEEKRLDAEYDRKHKKQ